MHIAKETRTLNEDTKTKLVFVLNPREATIPIGVPGAPVLAWGLCVGALSSAALTFLAIRFDVMKEFF
jgi:hypothetical protein